MDASLLPLLPLYPLRFTPILMPKVWGGHRLGEAWNKSIPEQVSIGESWEISGVPGNVSRVSNGALAGIDLQTLMNVRGEEMIGKTLSLKFRQAFPLLIKLIDAAEVLSVQVHPNDEQALKRHGCLGKTEMWYILEAGSEASIINGFNRLLSREEMQILVGENRIREVLRSVHPAPGDVFYIPGGRVHAIGKDIVLAEIQETSDITYRMYDWDRNQPDRLLHVEEALDVMDYSAPGSSCDLENSPEFVSGKPFTQNIPVTLVTSSHFTTNGLDLDQSVARRFQELGIDSFVIYLCIEGSVTVGVDAAEEVLIKGDTLLVPACINSVILTPHPLAKVLEVYVATK